MAEKKALQTIVEKYPFIVMDPTGALVAAEFRCEQEKQISTSNGLSNVKQHLTDKYWIMLDDEDKAQWNPRGEKRRNGPADFCRTVMCRSCYDLGQRLCVGVPSNQHRIQSGDIVRSAGVEVFRTASVPPDCQSSRRRLLR